MFNSEPCKNSKLMQENLNYCSFKIKVNNLPCFINGDSERTEGLGKNNFQEQQPASKLLFITLLSPETQL